MLEYAGVLREFACVCVNMLELLEFPRIRPGRFIRMRFGLGRLDEGRLAFDR